MRNATRIMASALGILAGLSGMEHGVFEILQGNIRPTGLMYSAIGAPCDPSAAWHACEPAMTFLPTLLWAGMATILCAIIILGWSIWKVDQKFGGPVLIALSIVFLLIGGGFFPPSFALIAGVTAIWMGFPLPHKPSSIVRRASTLWPWPLVLLLTIMIGQFPFGYFGNELLKSIQGPIAVVMLILLILSLFSAYARDVITSTLGGKRQPGGEKFALKT